MTGSKETPIYFAYSSSLQNVVDHTRAQIDFVSKSLMCRWGGCIPQTNQTSMARKCVKHECNCVSDVVVQFKRNFALRVPEYLCKQFVIDCLPEKCIRVFSHVV